MTDLDDKALDALQEETQELAYLSDEANYPEDGRYFTRVDDAITALRSRVQDSEATWLDGFRKGFRDARQVTREQHEELCSYLSNAFDPNFIAASAKEVLGICGLKIVEETPEAEGRKVEDLKALRSDLASMRTASGGPGPRYKAEGRQCDCPVYDKHGDANQYSVEYYDCARCNGFVTTRCTITEGGEDD